MMLMAISVFLWRTFENKSFLKFDHIANLDKKMNLSIYGCYDRKL